MAGANSSYKMEAKMTQLNELYRIDNYNDTFALGHYARVLDALEKRTGRQVAFKVMRPEHIDPAGDIRWEFQAFGNEAEILTRLSNSPNVLKLHDCGFISDQEEAPRIGNIDSFQKDVRGFVQAIPDYAGRGWRPYLALENMPRTDSLFYLMKPTRQNTRWRLPSEEGLSLAIQFSNLLSLAHAEQIVYLDYKLEHVYWDGTQLTVIDFNSSRQLENNNAEALQQYAKDVHNLCVGVLYTIFTGMSPQKTSIRPQPSNQVDVDARYTDVNELDFTMEPSLSESLCELLQRGASMRINSIQEFLNGLQRVAADHGWDFPSYYTSPASRDARDHMRAGLQRMREGQESIRIARDLFRDAVIQDGISPDLEDELRRLVVSINDMLTHRVIP